MDTFAATATWSGTADSTWDNGLNWSPAGTPVSSSTAVFNGAGNSNTAVTFAAGQTINSIMFDTASAAAYTIGTTSGQPLSLTASGTIQTTSSVANAETINAPISLLGNYTFSSGAASSSATLNFGGAITNVAASTLKLMGANTGTNTISGAIGNTIALNQLAGNWVLTGVNTYSGPTTIGASATLTIGGAGQLGGGAYAGTITNEGNFNFSSTAAQTFSGAITSSGSAGVLKVKTGSGPLTLSGNNSGYHGAVTVDQGATLVASTSGFALGGPSTIATINGTLNLNTGSLGITGLGGLQGGGVVTNINSVASAFRIGGSGSSKFDGVIQDASAPISVKVQDSATFTLTGNNNYTGGTNVGGTAATLILGQLSDTGASSIGHTGGITVGSGNRLKYQSTQGTSGSTGRTLTLGNSAGGNVYINSSSESPTATLTLSAATFGNQGTSGTTNYVLEGSNTGANTISSQIKNGGGTNIGAITKNDIGTWLLSGSNIYTGATSINSGMLQFAKKNALYSGSSANWTAAKITAASGATLAVNVGGTGEFAATDVNTLLSNISVANSSTTGLQAGSKIAFDTTNTTGGTFTQGNALTDSTGANGGSIGLSKLGGNTLVLNKVNTYTGATNITEGTLTLGATGSIANSSSIVVSRGATFDVSANPSFSVSSNQNLTNNGTLIGNLSVAGAVSGTGNMTGNLSLASGGKLSLASGIGTQSIADGLTLAAGSQLTMQLLTATSGSSLVGGVDYDQLRVGGNVALSGTLALNLGGIVQANDVFNLILASGSSSTLTGAFSAVTVNGTEVNNYSGNKFSYNGQDYTIITTDADDGGVANDLELVAIPENNLEEFGVCTHLCSYSDSSIATDEIIASGIKLVRTDASWSWLSQTRGTYNATRLAQLDDVINRLSARGVQIDLVLLNTAYWASSGTGNNAYYTKPANWQDWADYVNFICTRYNNKVTHYEVWNEEDYGTNWLSTSADYVTLLQTAAAQIHAVNPSNKVLLGGLACATSGTGTFFDTILGLGAANYFDIINYHTYGYLNSYGWNLTWKQTFSNMQAVINKYNLQSRKIWITETGYTTCGDASLEPIKAVCVDNAYYSLFNMSPNIEKVIMYVDRNPNTGNSAQDNFGLTSYAARTPLPAFYHYQAVGGARSDFAMQNAYPSTEYRRTLNYVVTGTGDGSFITDYDADGSTKRISASSYMYFQLNDAWMYNNIPQDQPYVDVTYLDSGTGQWSLQYDGTSNSYQSSPVIKTNTGAWLTQRFPLNDAKFANRQNYSSDFRLAASTDDLIVSDVKVSRDDTKGWAVLAADGTTDQSWQMWRVQNSGTTGSSYNPIATMGGVPCRQIIDNGHYIYFWVSENVLLPTDTNVTITITFWDAGTDRLSFGYNAVGNSCKSYYITKTNTNAWKTVAINLTDANFLDTINYYADFRITNAGDGSVEYVKSVNVQRTP